MTIASSCGWWTLLASLSVNVMAYLFATLYLRDHPKSWTFCTTFRYIFLDLEDCPIKVPHMITLISPSGGRDDSFSFPFTFSSLWSRLRKFLNFPYLWDSLSAASNQNTRLCHAHGLCGSGNTCSYCACWDLPSFFLATSRKGHPWFV